MAVFRIITVMLILAGSLAGLLFGTTYILDQSLDDPDVLVHAAVSSPGSWPFTIFTSCGFLQ